MAASQRTDSSDQDFEHASKIMGLFVDSTKTYMQLSTGSLVLSVAFLEKIVGSASPLKASGLLKAAWISFLVALGAGALYQYLAAKYLEASFNPGGPVFLLRPRWLRERPGIAFAFVPTSFYIGALLFVIDALSRF